MTWFGAEKGIYYQSGNGYAYTNRRHLVYGLELVLVKVVGQIVVHHVERSETKHLHASLGARSFNL